MAGPSTLVDNVAVYAASSGNGAITLGSAVAGYRGQEALLNGQTYSYSVRQDAQYEYGRGVYLSASKQLVRAPISSSNGNQPIAVGAGAAVSFVILAEDIVAKIVSAPLSGLQAPTIGVGTINDYYYDLSTPVTLYGPKTVQGWGNGVVIQGNQGQSVYDLWLQAGNVGSQAAFLASVVGASGKDGTPGGVTNAAAVRLLLSQMGKLQAVVDALPADQTSDVYIRWSTGTQIAIGDPLALFIQSAAGIGATDVATLIGTAAIAAGNQTSLPSGTLPIIKTLAGERAAISTNYARMVADLAYNFTDSSAVSYVNGDMMVDSRETSYRNNLWMACQAITFFYNDWKSASPTAATSLSVLTATAARVSSNYTTTQLRSDGAAVGTVGYSDDYGWMANMFCQFFEVTADRTWIDHFAESLPKVLTRFKDPSRASITTANGYLSYSPYGILYNTNPDYEPHNVSSSYEVMLACACMYLADHINDDSRAADLRQYAAATEAWVNTYLPRAPQGYLYCEMKLDTLVSPAAYYGTPVRGLSASYSAATAAMAVLEGRLYKATGSATYLARAAQYVAAMARTDSFMRVVPGLGTVWVNERDPYTDGAWHTPLVREVLPLAGVDPQGLFATTCRNTFRAIYGQRSFDGYYGADWSGEEADDYTHAIVNYSYEDTAGGLLGGSQADARQITTCATSASMAQAGWLVAQGLANDAPIFVPSLDAIYDYIDKAIATRAPRQGFIGRKGYSFSFNGSGGTFMARVATNITLRIDSGGITAPGITAESGYYFANDGTASVGSAARRASQIYAVNSTINTSDEREKQWRGPLTADEIAAGLEILPTIGTFQWLDEIVGKGEAARLHVGVRAQQIAAIFVAHGLDPTRYGLYCYDKWDAAPAVLEAPEDVRMRRAAVVLSEAVDAGDRYGIRPSELQYFLLAALAAHITGS